MTALEYMAKQAVKCQQNYERELLRGAPKSVLADIATKYSHYMKAVEALQALENLGELEFDYNAEDDNQC